MTVAEHTPSTFPELHQTIERTTAACAEYWGPEHEEPHAIEIDLRVGKGIAAFSSEALPIGKAIWVRESDAVYGVFVADCIETLDGYESTLEFLEGGTREDDRVPVGDRAKLVWHRPGEAYEVADIQVSNVSLGGMQMLCPEKVAVGSLVCVTGDDFQCLGTVCYCTASGDGFVAGMQYSKQPALEA